MLIAMEVCRDVSIPTASDTTDQNHGLRDRALQVYTRLYGGALPHRSQRTEQVSADGIHQLRHSVLIIDHHNLFSTALRIALRAEGLDAHQIPMAEQAAVLATATRFPAGVALLDLALTVATEGRAIPGVDLITALREHNQRTLVLNDGSDEAGTAAAIAAGAIGWLDRSASFDVLLRTLIAAAAGASVLTEADRQRWLDLHCSFQERQKWFAQRLQRLTPREQEMLGLLAGGYRACALAERFAASPTTVRTQIGVILAKLEVNSQLEAVALLYDDPLRHRMLNELALGRGTEWAPARRTNLSRHRAFPSRG
jgi:DNA-binding NarL/FixJ family response regulator